ncbi:hypothetical protein pb186bvf_020578 [Paramecium bursaria]
MQRQLQFTYKITEGQILSHPFFKYQFYHFFNYLYKIPFQITDFNKGNFPYLDQKTKLNQVEVARQWQHCQSQYQHRSLDNLFYLMNLFIFYDSSDYQMMKSVICDNFYICVRGLDSSNMNKKGKEMSFEDIGLDKCFVFDRDSKISNDQVEKLESGLKQIIQDKKLVKVISSVSSIIQGQILQASNNIGIETIAYWNFFTCSNDKNFYISCQVQHLARTVCFPTQYHYDIIPLKPQGNVIILGLPQIEQFQQEINSEYCYEFLQYLSQYGQFQYIITYCCLDDQDWMRGLLFFRDCLREYNTYDILYLITFDSKLDLTQLQELFKEFKNVVLQNQYFNVNKAIRISDLVLLHKSNSCFKIATIRNILFLVDDESYSNPLLESNQYSLVNKTENFERILHRILNVGNRLPNIYGILGMPCKSIELITKLLN